MSARRYISPPNLLAAALDLAAPQLAEQAIERAETNLSTMSDECRARIDDLLKQIDATAGEVSAAGFDATVLDTYSLAVKVVGLGTPAGYPEVDVAAKSLCDVLDGLLASGVQEKRFPTLVMVHTSTMRQLRSLESLGEGAAALLQGLSTLRARFAVPIGRRQHQDA